jgi:hypothetical protein
VNAVNSTTTAIQEIFADPATSDWLKGALRTALDRDPVDSLNDALVLVDALEDRLRETFGLSENS